MRGSGFVTRRAWLSRGAAAASLWATPLRPSRHAGIATTATAAAAAVAATTFHGGGSVTLAIVFCAVTAFYDASGKLTLVSQGEFAKRANTACRQANSQVSALPQPAVGLAGVAQYASELQPIASHLVANLSALQAPKSLRPRFNSYLGKLRSGGVCDLRTGDVHDTPGQIVRTCVSGAAGDVEIEL